LEQRLHVVVGEIVGDAAGSDPRIVNVEEHAPPLAGGARRSRVEGEATGIIETVWLVGLSWRGMVW